MSTIKVLNREQTVVVDLAANQVVSISRPFELVLDTIVIGSTSHDHDEEYSPVAHNHDGVYSPSAHNHDGVYSLVGHDHDGVYSPFAHDHDGVYEEVGVAQALIDSALAGFSSGGAVRSDQDGNYSYIGTAPKGSLDSSSVWKITRILLDDASTTMAVDVAWDDRLTETYA